MMDKVCANCMWCVLDTCEYEEESGYKRKMYVGRNNTISGCNQCLTKEEYDRELEIE